MEFAFNYSPLLAELVREGLLRVDRFKCPAWPDLLLEARRTLPIYVHFPLLIGGGGGMPIDAERRAPVDLERLSDLLEMSGTPLINTHLMPAPGDYPGIPPESRDPRHIQQVISGALRDLEPLIRRFGAERVLVENIILEPMWLALATMPEVMAELLERSGCGFLFDLSHARMAAAGLGIDPRAYADSLPVERIREIHVTGIQMMAGALLERVRAATSAEGFGGLLIGKPMDHLPMTDADWTELEWMMGRIRQGAWPTPWVVACETGGVGGFWEVIMDRAAYLDQVPRMEMLVRFE